MACPTARRVGPCGETTGFLCPLPRSKTGWRPGEKKVQSRMDTEFLDWALADFSGYVAADELYDGPFCILSAVDNRCYKRILYDVLDHDPTHDDIWTFLRRLHTALSARDLTLLGPPVANGQSLAVRLGISVMDLTNYIRSIPSPTRAFTFVRTSLCYIINYSPNR